MGGRIPVYRNSLRSGFLFLSFLTWTIFKVFIEFVTIVPLLGSSGVLAPQPGLELEPETPH